MKNNQLVAYLKLSLAIIGWAGVYHSANYLVHRVDLYSVAFVRYFCASLILIAIMKARRGYIFDKQLFKDNWLILINLGIVGIGCYNLVFFLSEKYLSAGMVALIFSITPCLTALLSSWYFRQRISLYAYASMSMALLGTIGVINYSNPSCQQYWCNLINNISIGEISTIALCFLAATFSIMSRIATNKNIDSLSITTYAAVFGTIVLFVAMLIAGKPQDLLAQDGEFWIVMTYTFLIGSVLSYFWYSESIATLGISKVVVFLNGIPFTTILIGVVFFNQPISLPVMLCGLIIIIGVIITNKVISR